MRVLIGAMLAFGFSVSVAASPATSAQWSEIPNTRLETVTKADGTLLVPPSLPHGGETGTATAIINAWNSAAPDPSSGRVYFVRHGGHADTAHNGVFALDLSTFKWSMLRDTSRRYVPIPPPAGAVYEPTYLDGSPASVHTYDCEEYLPNVRRVYSGGGIFWSPAGESVPQVVFSWNPTTNAYERRAVRPGGYSCVTVWNPITNRLIMRISGKWLQYNPATDTYETLSTAPAGNTAESSTLFLDAAGGKVYRIEKRVAGTVPSIRMLDLHNLAAKEQTLFTEGDTAIEMLGGVGGAFVGGRIAAYGRTADGTRGALYYLIPGACGGTGQAKCRWTRLDFGNPIPPLPDYRGMWKRAFAYQGKFFVLPSARENLWGVPLPWTVVAGPPLPSTPTPTPTPVPNPLPSPTPSPTPTPTPIPIPIPTPTTSPTPIPTPTPTPSPVPAGTPYTKTVLVPGTDLSARWNAYPLWASGAGPMARGGKHARLVYDTRRHRLVLTGGDRDGSDAGNPSVWAFMPGSGATQLSAMCRPYPDWLPSFPDNVTWVYDSVRDRMIVMPGFFFDLSRAQTMCGRSDDRILKITLPTGEVRKNAGIFNPSTNAWSPPTWPFPSELGYGGDVQANWSVYDPQKDMVVRFYWDGAWGNNLQVLHLASNAWTRFKLGSGVSDGTRIRNTYATNGQPALDVQGRSLYVVAPSTVSGVLEGRLLKVNVDTGTAQRLPLPAGYVWPVIPEAGATEQLLVFDPIRRLLIHPAIPNLGGDVGAVYICSVDRGCPWVKVPLPTSAPPLKGNVAGMDTDHGALVLIGGHAVTKPDGTRTPSPTHYWTLTLTRQ